MAGLIQNVVPDPTLVPVNPEDELTQAASFGYDPTLGTVNLATDTVSGQLDAILAQDSPLMQAAGAQGAQSANARGLLNSTMGVQAGQQAIVNAALPIAQQDAGTYFQQNLANQGVSNTASQFSTAAANTADLANAAAANQISQITTAGEETRLTQEQTAASDLALQELKGVQANELANIEALYKVELQTSASAAAFLTQYSNNVATILNDPNTTVEQKQSAIDAQTEVLKDTLTVIGAIGNIDLTALLDFTEPAAEEPPPPPPPPPPPEEEEPPGEPPPGPTD